MNIHELYFRLNIGNGTTAGYILLGKDEGRLPDLQQVATTTTTKVKGRLPHQVALGGIEGVGGGQRRVVDRLTVIHFRVPRRGTVSVVAQVRRCLAGVGADVRRKDGDAARRRRCVHVVLVVGRAHAPQTLGSRLDRRLRVAVQRQRT